MGRVQREQTYTNPRGLAMTGIKLYEATAQLEVVNGWIEEHADEILANGGELPPALAELLDQAEGTLAVKAERVALKVRELQAEADAVKAEAVRLTQRAKTATNAADSLKAYLKRALEIAGVQTIKGELVTVALQKNPPSVLTVRDAASDDAAEGFATEIPAHYEWNKAELKEAWKAGEALPMGVAVMQGTSLRIR